ncbi:MAG: GNAT family N-acetyltransferase [Chitinophagales bacterium]
MNLNWTYKSFDEFTIHELYEVIALRLEVFSVEQNCPYQDLDGKDQKSGHLMGYADNGDLAAYARILPQGVSYKEVSIGRIVTSPQYRSIGLGKALMQKIFAQIEGQFGQVAIRISAQCYLDRFYRSLDFVPVGESYLEDNIPHIEMLRIYAEA